MNLTSLQHAPSSNSSIHDHHTHQSTVVAESEPLPLNLDSADKLIRLISDGFKANGTSKMLNIITLSVLAVFAIVIQFIQWIDYKEFYSYLFIPSQSERTSDQEAMDWHFIGSLSMFIFYPWLMTILLIIYIFRNPAKLLIIDIWRKIVIYSLLIPLTVLLIDNIFPLDNTNINIQTNEAFIWIFIICIVILHFCTYPTESKEPKWSKLDRSNNLYNWERHEKRLYQLLKFDFMVMTMLGFATMIAPNFRYYFAHNPEITKSVLLWQRLVGCFEFHVGISCYFAANIFSYFIIKRNEDRCAVFMKGLNDIEKLASNESNTESDGQCPNQRARTDTNITNMTMASIDEDEEVHKLFEKESEGYIQFVYYHIVSFIIMFLATAVINWIAHLTIPDLLEGPHWIAPIGIPIYLIVHIYYFMFMLS